jgi:hypothetical protein
VASVKDGWYEKRMSWFTELIDTMKVPTQSIEIEMKKIKIAETRLEIIDQEGIINSLSAFVDFDSIGIHS